MRILKQSARKHPRLSLIFLDWGVRESFHIFHYLKTQNVPRDAFETILVEYYGTVSRAAENFEAEIDSWILLEMPRDCYYHKHLMYNAGIVLSGGEITMIADSDAMVRPTFVETVLNAFARDPHIVYHMDEFRNIRRDFYPFNFPSFEEVLGEGCINNVGNKTKGVLDEIDPMHTRNFGACMCAWRKDLIDIGGADEDITYLGHICGPYDMTFRLLNLGRRMVWETDEYLYHTWHPGTDGTDNYLGPHDGRNMSTTAFEALCAGRVPPRVENKAIKALRAGLPPDDPVTGFRNLIVDPAYVKNFSRSVLGRFTKSSASSGELRKAFASYSGCDIYHLDGTFYAVPQTMVSLDLARAEWRTDERVVRGQSFAEVRDKLEHPGKAEGAFQAVLVETVGQCNICMVGRRFAVVPQALGAIDFRAPTQREDPRIVWADTVQEARGTARQMNARVQLSVEEPFGQISHAGQPSQPAQRKSSAAAVSLSLIVPTRRRTAQLRRLLDSVKSTVQDSSCIEVILVRDEDDEETAAFSYNGLALKFIVVPCGLSMGALNMAGYRAAAGPYLMLLNDDVVVRTPGWDHHVLAALQSCPDGIVLVHVNDQVFREDLCVFPLLTREFCRLAGGICHEGYRRYRIDDHIHNVFDLMSLLGHRRRIFLPDVVFEHTNFEKDPSGRPVYLPHPAIQKQDTILFDSLLDERKHLALKAIEHIEGAIDPESYQPYREQLNRVTDSIAIRRPEHARFFPTRRQQHSHTGRVTIAIVSADLRSPGARRCVDLIRTHTTNYDLILVDHNAAPDFNRAREANRILSNCQSQYLVLMDDEVFVQAGWLEGMTRALGPDVAVVSPFHKSSPGGVSYAGIVMCPDDTGHYMPIEEPSAAPRSTQTFSGAVCLIDLTKVGNIRFDEGYAKHFADIDYGLRVWEAGYQVVCSPYAEVAYPGGVKPEQANPASARLGQQQRRRFVETWAESGRLQRLRRGIWRTTPEISWLAKKTREMDGFLQAGTKGEKDQCLRQAAALLSGLAGYPVFKDYVASRALAAVRCIQPPESGARLDCLTALLDTYGAPVLCEEGFHGMNIVVLQNLLYYALPQGEGAFSYERMLQNAYSRSFEAGTLEELKALIVEHRDSPRCGHVVAKPRADAASAQEAPQSKPVEAPPKPPRTPSIRTHTNPLAHFLETGAAQGQWPNSLFDPVYYLSANPDVAAAGLNPLAHFLEVGARQGRKPNPLFDTGYYVRQNPEVAESGVNPLEHFLETGASKGRKPNPLFDPAYYLEKNPDVASSGMNPLAHFLEIGAKQGRRPNPLFEPDYYLRHNPDVVAAGLNPLVHFLEFGALDGRWPNPLFDTAYYVRSYSGLASAGLNPLEHFLEWGARDGCRPNPLFHTSFYLLRYPDVAEGEMNPLAHYLDFGAAEGRWPNPLFDTAYYIRHNPDVAREGMNPLAHFLEYGIKDKRRPNALFDIGYYLQRNPDLASAGTNPLAHFLDSGWREGRRPNALFDVAYYLDQNPDVAAAGVNPLAHFLESGAKEGRRPNPLFDIAYYLQLNPDVTVGEMNALEHFLESGAREGRRPNPLFDPAYYLLRYPDVAAIGQNPLAHFLEFGAAEGRRPNPLFDTAQYLELNPGLIEAGINPLAHYLDSGRVGMPVPAAAASAALPRNGSSRPTAPSGQMETSTVRAATPAGISVVIPTCNRAELLSGTLEACLRSAAGCKLEIIVIDDGSTDDTRQRLAALAATTPQLSWYSVGKMGPAYARNVGANTARHEVILFLGDDIRPLNDDFFRVHGQLHATHPDENLAVLGKVIWPNWGLERINYTMAHVQGVGAQQFGYSSLTPYSFVNWPDFYTANISVKRSLVKDWMRDGFNPDFPTAAFEDLEFAYRISKSPAGLKIFYDPTAVAGHHHQYSLAEFMQRQTRSGKALALFIQLHPESVGEFDLLDIVEALRAPRRTSEEQLHDDFRLVIIALQAMARALESQGKFGTEPWHGDFLSAVLDLCLVDGLVSSLPTEAADMTAVSALMLDRFRRRMRQPLVHELANWGFLAKLVPEASLGLLNLRQGRAPAAMASR